MRAAHNPITKAVESKSIWKPSDIKPRLFVRTPYNNSTAVKAYNISKLIILSLVMR